MYVLVNTPSRNQGPVLVTYARSLFLRHILGCPWTAFSFLLKQCGRRFICLIESSNNCLHFENGKFHTVSKCITCDMFSLSTVSLSWGLVIVQGNGVLASLFSLFYVIREFDGFLRRFWAKVSWCVKSSLLYLPSVTPTHACGNREIKGVGLFPLPVVAPNLAGNFSLLPFVGAGKKGDPWET